MGNVNCWHAALKPCTETPRRAALVATVLLCQACAPGPLRRDTPAPAASAVTSSRLAQANPAAQQDYSQALSLLDEGDVDAALALLIELRKRYPQLSGPATNLGILLAGRGDEAAALAQFQHASQVNPANIIALNWQASLLRKRGRLLEAESALLQALRAAPDDLASHRNLALLYQRELQRPQAALKHYQRYLDLDGDEPWLVQAWMRRIQDAAQLAKGATP